jgi:hypothetical protein
MKKGEKLQLYKQGNKLKIFRKSRKKNSVSHETFFKLFFKKPTIFAKKLKSVTENQFKKANFPFLHEENTEIMLNIVP